MLIFFSAFLADHPRETIITCIQQEVPSSSLLFSSLVRQAMDPYIRRGEWFLENRIPQMGEVRGKAVLMSRFGGSPRDGGEIPWLDLDPSFEPSETHYYEGESFSPAPCSIARMGWKPERWPDSVLDGFIWHADETPCRTQDWSVLFLHKPEARLIWWGKGMRFMGSSISQRNSASYVPHLLLLATVFLLTTPRICSLRTTSPHPPISRRRQT